MDCRTSRYSAAFFKFQIASGGFHLVLDFLDNLIIMPCQELGHFLSHLVIVRQAGHVFSMGQTLPQMIIKTILVLRQFTLAERIEAFQQFEGLVGRTHIWIGTKILTAIFFICRVMADRG